MKQIWHVSSPSTSLWILENIFSFTISEIISAELFDINHFLTSVGTDSVGLMRLGSALSFNVTMEYWAIDGPCYANRV